MNRDPNFGFQNRKETFFPETSDNFIWGSTLNFLDHLKKCSRATNKLLVEIFLPKFCNVSWSMIHGIYWTENWTAGAFSDQWKYEDDNNDNKISSSWEFKNESKSILRLNCTDQSNVTNGDALGDLLRSFVVLFNTLNIFNQTVLNLNESRLLEVLLVTCRQSARCSINCIFNYDYSVDFSYLFHYLLTDKLTDLIKINSSCLNLWSFALLPPFWTFPHKIFMPIEKDLSGEWKTSVKGRRKRHYHVIDFKFS